ncbi:MAG: hypothetical protein ACTSX7_09095 [Alphaproteobacteria bacterium]
MVAGIAALTLAACSSPNVASIPPCPNVVIVDDIAQMTKFLDGPGRDLTDVVLEVRIASFDGSCVTDPDAGAAGEVSVDLILVVEATRGPANANNQGQYDFFIAIAETEGDIVAKRVFPGEVVFEGNRNRVAAQEELTQMIPLRPGENGADYDILIGFQLSDEELVYARQQRRVQ